MKRNLKYFLIFFIPFILDRLTKSWVLKNINELPKLITSFFKLDLIFNRGVSWGFLNYENTTAFVTVTFFTLLVLFLLAIYTLSRYKNNKRIYSELLILSGATSNLWDRLESLACISCEKKGVVDFIIFHFKDWSWPAFNIADICIVLGVGLMSIQILREKK